MQNRRKLGSTVALAVLAALCISSAQAQPAEQSKHWRHYPMRPEPPANAPNVLLIMADDVGYGASSTFGGAIETPTFDTLARDGLRYTAFHTTGMCSPTRAALLTGRNHHAVDSGPITNLARDLDGYTSSIPDTAATVARVLRDAGYSTAMFGKNHNTPLWETGDFASFDRWPTGLGFDYFYGFNDAWANQFAPELVENTNQIRPPNDDPGYTLDRDLSDHLIGWLRRQQLNAPDRPFFAYLAPGSPHTPHHAPADWIARFRGRFDQGWDALREETFARQKGLGVVPRDAQLTQRPSEFPAWDSLPPGEQRVAARMMEVYAAQLSHMDHQIGRVIEELRRTGELDNTLIIFIEGDNGGDLASFRGAVNEWGAFFGEEPTYREMAADIDELGGPRAFGGYPAPWAWAMDTPFQWGKALPGFLGGTRSGLVISWPEMIHANGEIRTQFHHVIDIAPTIYEAAGITPPESVDGVAQQRIDGASMVYTFDNASAGGRRREQYFEMLGNLGFYRDGWLAATTPQRFPWDRTSPRTPLPESVAGFQWELYNLNTDYSQSRNVAAEQPEKLRQMIAGFSDVARENHVFPLENDVMTLLAPGTRPSVTEGRTSLVYYPSEERYVSAAIPGLGGNWRVTAKVNLPSGGPSGPIFVQGDRFSGWGLLLDRGKPTFILRQTDDPASMSRVAAPRRLAPGPHVIETEFRRNPDRTALAILKVDGQEVARGAIAKAGIVGRAANVGRYGEVSLLDGRVSAMQCQCGIEEVRLELLGR